MSPCSFGPCRENEAYFNLLRLTVNKKIIFLIQVIKMRASWYILHSQRTKVRHRHLSWKLCTP
ncbi:hypothetical protein ETB66_10825 [Vibrio parahaemolyticus]|nr:hypothetical protein [Vibrio parahaemolyticus]